MFSYTSQFGFTATALVELPDMVKSVFALR